MFGTSNGSGAKRLGVLALVAVVVASLAFVAPVAAQSDQENGTAQVRVVHASPDAPAVDVAVDNETVLENVTFGSVSDYLEVPAGDRQVTVTTTENGSVVYDDTLTVAADTAYTVAAAGEVTAGANTTFQPVVLVDNASAPEAGNAAVRVAHLSPDAPAVDVVASETGTILADNLTFGNATGYQSVPADNYTVDVRVATAPNDGPIVASTNTSLTDGQVSTVFALGYLNASEAPADTPFQFVLTTDETATDETATNETATTEEAGTTAESPGTATDASGTETDSTTEVPITSSGTETDTETP